MDKTTQTELEAAAFRRLLAHLRRHEEVQNIDLMGYAGFCRNCLSDWYKDAADERGIAISKDEARQHIYGEPYADWKARQPDATQEQIDRMNAFKKKTGHS